jgi:hypothetical protein
LTGLIGSGEFTFVLEASIDALGRTSGSDPGIFAFDDGTANNRFGFVVDDDGSDLVTAYCVRAGAKTSQALSAVTAQTNFKVGVRATASAVHVSMNGSTPVAVGSGAAPAITRLLLGQYAGTHLGGAMASVRPLARAATDAEFQAMTT